MCTSPLLIQSEGILAPCRNCKECRIARSSEWALRLSHESLYHRGAIFVTLTYAPEHVPEHYSLDKAQLQRFLKRLRKDISSNYPHLPKLKYYACGEYGEKKLRPHYHLIIFGLKLSDLILIKKGNYFYVQKGLLKDSWTLGIVQAGTAEPASMSYTTAYIQKKLTGKLAKENYEKTNRQPPFQLSSQGFGKQWAIENSENLKANLNIQFGEKKAPIPHYYRDKINLDPDLLKPYAIQNQQKRVNALYEALPDASKNSDRIQKLLAFVKGDERDNAYGYQRFSHTSRSSELDLEAKNYEILRNKAKYVDMINNNYKKLDNELL